MFVHWKTEKACIIHIFGTLDSLNSSTTMYVKLRGLQYNVISNQWVSTFLKIQNRNPLVSWQSASKEASWLRSMCCQEDWTDKSTPQLFLPNLQQLISLMDGDFWLAFSLQEIKLSIIKPSTCPRGWSTVTNKHTVCGVRSQHAECRYH